MLIKLVVLSAMLFAQTVGAASCDPEIVDAIESARSLLTRPNSQRGALAILDGALASIGQSPSTTSAVCEIQNNQILIDGQPYTNGSNLSLAENLLSALQLNRCRAALTCATNISLSNSEASVLEVRLNGVLAFSKTVCKNYEGRSIGECSGTSAKDQTNALLTRLTTYNACITDLQPISDEQIAQARQDSLARRYRCSGSNYYGNYAQGGDCNYYGCFKPGGGCNYYGCYWAGGDCTYYGCTNAAGQSVNSRPFSCTR